MIAIPWSLPPIIERELRLAARHNSTYWSRVGAGTVGILVFLTVMNAQLAIAPAANAGRTTFQVLAWVAGFMVVSAVVRLAATAFAREKREDTLGLLFLTPLKPVELAAGKLVAASLGAFYRFVALIPLLALPMLVGGVSAGTFLLLVLALVNLVFYAATLGLWVSAHSWDEKRAVTTATLWLFAASVVLPSLGMGLAGTLGFGAEGAYVAGFSPIFPVWQATVPGAGRSFEIWWSLIVTQALAWQFFRTTCRALPVCWRNKPLGQESVLGQERLRREAVAAQRPDPVARAVGPVSVAAAGRARRMVRRQFTTMHRQQLLERNPILWLAQRWRADASLAWVVGSMGGVVAFVVGGLGSRWEPGLLLFACFCVNAGFKLHVATQAGTAFARDRAEDTLELLLCTPVTPRQLVHGHLEAIFAPLRVWIRRVIWIECAWMILMVVIELSRGREVTWVYPTLFVGMIVLFIPDLRAVAWCALWQGVVSKNARAATSNAQGAVLFQPWILSACAAVIGGWLGNGTAAWVGFLVSFFVLSLAFDRLYIRSSRRRLDTDLRLWAVRRSAGELEHYDAWRRLGRRLGQWWRRGRGSV